MSTPLENNKSYLSKLKTSINSLVDTKIATGINFVIADGEIEPIPMENMLWVKTRNSGMPAMELTEYEISPTRPETATEGFVWIGINTNGATNFNAVSENRVLIYPISCCIWYQGEWIDRGLKLYQNGEWIEITNDPDAALSAPVNYELEDGSQLKNNTIIIRELFTSIGGLPTIETGINFTIVDGESEPTPTENMLWVKTRDGTFPAMELTEYEISPTRPETATEGFVWIGAGTEGAISFNIISNNKLVVYPTSCSIWHNGEWRDRGLKLYQNGEWIEITNDPDAFPEVVNSYQKCAAYTSNETWVANKNGYFQIEAFGSSGAGYRGSGSSSTIRSGGGGGGGGYACSRIKMCKGDTIDFLINEDRSIDVIIDSSIDDYDNITITSGKDSSGTTGGAGGAASGGNWYNCNGSRGDNGETKYPSSGSYNICYGGTGGSPGRYDSSDTRGNYGGDGGRVTCSSAGTVSTYNGETGKEGYIEIYEGT